MRALNHGLASAHGDLIARMDADDLMPELRLERQAIALDAHSEWTLCGGQVEYKPLQGHSEGAGMKAHVRWLNSLDTPTAIANARLIDAPVAHPSVMFRRTEIMAAGGYRDGDFPEDYDLWLRLFAGGHVFGKIHAPVLTWRDHANRLTRVDSRYASDRFRVLKHAHLLTGPLASGRHCVVWGAGRFGRRHAKELVQAGARVDALIDIDPRKIGRRVAGGLPVIAASSLRGPDGRLILLAVASRGARQEIQATLDGLGHRPGHDYLALQ